MVRFMKCSIDDSIIKKMYKKALKARKNAYAPYSDFEVGAALLTEEGKIFTGSNVENVSYGLSNCAERSAIFSAVSCGYRKYKVLLITADTAQPVAPCGSCRQVIKEFGNNIIVIMTNLEGNFKYKEINELLPDPFEK